MAATKPVNIGGFAGIDNISAEDALRPGAARELVNVDLRDGVKPHRRGGYVNRLACDYAHSVASASEAMFAVVDGTLSALARQGEALVVTHAIRAGMGERPVHYAEINGETYWVNGAEFRRIRAGSLADTPGWIDCIAQPSVAVSASSGGLAAGDYQVVQTFVDASGRESGAVDAVVVTVPEGGGLLVEAAGAPADAVTARFYVSPRNGDVLYHARDVLLPHPPVLIGAGVSKRKPLETQFLMPLPAGQILAAWGARLWSAVDDLLFFGVALRYGLCQYDSAFRFGGRITMVQPTGDKASSGLFVGAGRRTHFLSGPPEACERDTVYPHGVREGSGRTVPGTLFGLDYAGPVAFWVATNGVCCVGLPSGQVLPLTEGQVVIPGAERMAVLVRERGGLQQIVMALQGQITGNSLAMGDAAETTVRRNGIDF
jgi:hypothetical protein